MTMRLSLLALLALGGALLAGGAAAAHDDCRYVHGPNLVCLLDDHTYLEGYTNTPLSTRAFVAGWSWASLGQSSWRAYDGARYAETSARVGDSYAGGGEVRAGQWNDFRPTSSYSWYTTEEHQFTGVGARRSVLGHGVEAEAGQWKSTRTTPYGATTACENGARAVALGIGLGPALPCTAGAWPVSIATALPLLQDQCVATPSAQACARFPDWPEYRRVL